MFDVTIRVHDDIIIADALGYSLMFVHDFYRFLPRSVQTLLQAEC